MEGVPGHARPAVEMFREGVRLAEAGDVVQGSEELYKAVEEAIKALAIAKGLPEAAEAASKGRWTVALLDRAARRLGEEVYRAWDAAYFLHVNGFHEVRVEPDDVKARIKHLAPAVERAGELTSIE